MVCHSIRFNRLAVIGALAVGLALAGCGRKGGLEAPPGASLEERAAAGDPAATPTVTDQYGRPIAPANIRKKTIFLDALLD